MQNNLLPRWRGFNLLDLFTVRSEGNFSEDDFRWMADWGFNFARIPACYTLWTEPQDDPADVTHLSEAGLAKVDRAVRLGQQYGIHICLNFHRAPGFSVNPERQEPFDLWKDQAALDAFCFHWQAFTQRYQGISNQQLSFNLVNEPIRPSESGMTRADHERVMRAAVQAVRELDPQRLIILDGVSWGNETLPELADLGVGQSCRAYQPMNISHYQASWVQSQGWAEPTYPGPLADGFWDRARLEAHYAPWIALKNSGVGVHCGEGGAFAHTPHEVVLAWLADVLDILTSNGIGYALWNLRGEFGILDSHRSDVAYEDWHGHLLDRELLNLLQSY
jgi:endoglucanase